MSVRLATLTDADVAAERERFPGAFGRPIGERMKSWLGWGGGAALTVYCMYRFGFFSGDFLHGAVEIRAARGVAAFSAHGLREPAPVPEGHRRDDRDGVSGDAAGRAVRVSAELSCLQEHHAIAPAPVRHAAVCRPSALVRLLDLGAHFRPRDRPRPTRRNHGDCDRRDRDLHQIVFGSDRESRSQADRWRDRGGRKLAASELGLAFCRRCCR